MTEVTIDLETIISLDQFGGVVSSLVKSEQSDGTMAIATYEKMAQESYAYSKAYDLLTFASRIANFLGDKQKEMELYAKMGEFNCVHFRGAAYVALAMGDRESAKKYFEFAAPVGDLSSAETLYLEEGDVQGAIDLNLRHNGYISAYHLAKRMNHPDAEKLYQAALDFFESEKNFLALMYFANEKGDVEKAKQIYDLQLTAFLEDYDFKAAKNFAKEYGKEEDVDEKIKAIEKQNPEYMSQYNKGLIEKWCSAPKQKEHMKELSQLATFVHHLMLG